MDATVKFRRRKRLGFSNFRLKYIAGIALLCGLMLLLGVYVIISHLTIYPGFAKVENHFAQKDIQRCNNAIKREIYHLGIFTQDWAIWDDTYRFIKDHNPDYIESNLGDEAFATNNIHLMYFLNNDKQLIWHRIYNEDGDLTEEQLSGTHRILTGLFDRIMSEKDEFGVLVTTSSYPLLLSSHGIYDSEETKPRRGFLIMGRFLNPSTIDELVEQTQVHFEMLNIADAFDTDTADKTPVQVQTTSDNKLLVSTICRDLNNKPAYEIRATVNRDITTEGKYIIILSFIIIIAASMVLFTMLMYVLERFILHPVSSLTQQIRNIRKTGTFTHPVEVSNGHETQILANEFNRLMRRLEFDRKKRLQIETKLIESAQTAKRASQAKSDFLANMSHEIRTPMNSILGFSDLMMLEDLNDQQRDYIETIRVNGKSLLSLINDILDMTKIESGNMTIEEIECSLTDIAIQIEHFIKPLASEKSLQFKLTIAPDIPETLVTDSLRLRQCLINLLGNAVKFTAEGYVHLHIDTSQIDQEPAVCFRIEDTGIGISPDKKKEIFQPFMQADTSTTRKYGGTGLGLSISQNLVKLLGGTLTLESQPGTGSVFEITLPIKEIPASQNTADTPDQLAT